MNTIENSFDHYGIDLLQNEISYYLYLEQNWVFENIYVLNQWHMETKDLYSKQKKTKIHTDFLQHK